MGEGETCGSCKFYYKPGNQNEYCLRYPPSTFPMPGKSPLGQPALSWISSMTPVQEKMPACGEYRVNLSRVVN